MHAYVVGIAGIYPLILIEDVTICLPIALDIYSHKYEVFLLLVSI